jgi:hypothetical protein
MINIHFIRAAILQRTGIALSLEETRDILVSEGMLSAAKAKNILFRGYGEFYDFFYKQDATIVETKQSRLAPLDLVEMIENQEKHIE